MEAEARTNPKEACRLCLRGKGDISVWGDGSEDRRISAQNIYDCVSVKINKDDKLPTGVCQDCRQSVESWCTFKRICDRTQKILQRWLVQDNLDVKADLEVPEDGDETSSVGTTSTPAVPTIEPKSGENISGYHDPMETSDSEGAECIDLCDSVVNSNDDASRKKADESISNLRCIYDAMDTVNKNSKSIVQSDYNESSLPESESGLKGTETSTDKPDRMDDEIMCNKSKRICLDNEDSDSVEIIDDREISMPSSCNSELSSKTDNTSDKVGDGPAVCEEDDVEFTTAVTIDVNPFPDGSGTENNEANKNLNTKRDLVDNVSTNLSLKDKVQDLPSQIKEVKEPISIPSPKPKVPEAGEVVSSSVSTPVENIDDKEGEVSSSVEKQHLNTSEDDAASDKPSENPNDLIDDKEKDIFEPLIAIIKEEPIDSTTDDAPNQPPFQVRVKSEFSNFNFRSDSHDDQPWGNASKAHPINPDDPNNSECFICNRKYSTVSNYKQHLQTKMHLFNSGQLVEPSPGGKEPQGELPSTFESPLLRSRLSSDPLNQPSYAEASPPHDPLTLSSLHRRRPVDHCRLCNTSFTYTSELRKHLLSKKHRFNARLSRYKDSHPLNSVSKPMPPQLGQHHLDSSQDGQSSSKSIFICPIPNCNFSAIKGESLLFHMKSHGIPVGKIEEAGKPKLSLRQQDIMKRDAEIKQIQEEQELMRQQMQAPAGHFECEGCHKAFFRESGLKKHSWYCKVLNATKFKQEVMEYEEMEEEDVDDDEDDVDVDDEEDEEDEEQVFGQNEDSGGSESHCPLCDISFTARNVFINHVQIYHKGSFLEDSLAKKASLAKKVPQNPSAKPAKVPYFQVPNKIRVTNKTHGFSCDICGKKFNLLSSLNFHVKTHTVSVRHICRICKEPFNNRKAFMEHCRQHFLKPGSKETLCHKCFKVFKTRSELYQHKKHDQCSIKMKIYSCNFCQHSFKDPNALEEHKVMSHNESLDISEDAMNESSFGELYDDSLIPLNPLGLLSQQNESLPGTSSRMSAGYPKVAKKVPSSNPLNFSSQNQGNYAMKNSPSYSPSQPGVQPPLQCNICKTIFSSKQALKKHTLKFHILNKPYSGSKRYGSQRRSLLPSNVTKHWKCKHCKQAFRTRKVLVYHLKRCDYNAFEDMKGICLQCGKWCESGKTRICQYCLPDLAKDPEFDHRRYMEINKMRRYESMYSANPQPSNVVTVKQEFPGQQLLESMKQEFLGQTTYNAPQGNTHQKLPENINSEANPAFEKGDLKPKSEGINLSFSDIRLMKCPVGNKYFRSEMTMVKHYSECDGTCENRCSHCRKLFNSPKEYKHHLIYSRCFGPNKVDSKKRAKLRYPTFACKRKKIRRDLSVGRVGGLREADIRMKLASIDDNFDNRTEMSNFSEDNSMGVESTSSVSLVNKAVEEKSLKLGRICTICNKVITMQRAVYRHAYGCVKTLLLTQDSVSCPKCLKSFTKQVSMKDNASGIKQHILDCYFIPYYVDEGINDDGSRQENPPPHLCYICSFGFSSNENLMMHVKEHRSNKDEVNNIVLQLEEGMLTDERLSDESSMFSLHIDDIKPPDAAPVLAGRVLSLPDALPRRMMIPAKLRSPKIYQCDSCSRKFYNKKKYLRHKRVHGIITETVYKEAAEQQAYVDLECDNLVPTPTADEN